MSENENKVVTLTAVKERKRLPVSQRSRQNYPIENALNVSRVYEKEPVNETCWAYMKLLRESNKTKKVYPVDPYAEVYQFRDNTYGLLMESLDGMGDAWSYLIVGPEKAMLIDTNFGLGNLKGLVDEITGGKELIVVNTHSHFDHAYGNAQFDTVYCHEYEAPYIEKQNEHIWDYLFDEETGEGIWSDFNRADIIPFKKYNVVACPDGYIFNLGEDYDVELIFLGGHSAGHAGFLDKKGRNLFAGDDIISMRVGVSGPKPGMPYGEYASVSAMRDNMEKIAARIDEYDHVFSGHFVTDLEAYVIKNMLDACNAVVANPTDCAYSRVTNRGTQYFKYVEGLGTLAYFIRDGKV